MSEQELKNMIDETAAVVAKELAFAITRHVQEMLHLSTITTTQVMSEAAQKREKIENERSIYATHRDE